jgi:hypothetical protein
MIEAGGDASKKAYREETDLRNLVQSMIAPEPEKRVANMSTLKSRLERLGWKDAPRPSAVGVMETPITVLTTEEVDKFQDIKHRIKVGILLTITAMLLLALIGQTLFPDAEVGF